MGRPLTTYSYIASQELWNMVCSLFGVHWVMLRSVVKLSASCLNKFNRLRSKVCGEWSLIVLCGSVGGKGIHIPLTRMKDRFMSWSFSFFRLCLNGQMLLVFNYYFFSWYAWFLYFHGYIVFSLCAFLFLCIFSSFFNEVYYLSKKLVNSRWPISWTWERK